MKITDVITEQGTFAFVEFLVGDENIVYTPNTGPRRLMSFTSVRRTEISGYNRFEAVLFDENWYEVESLLAMNYRNLLFRYGYYTPDGNMLSNWASGSITNLIPQIVIDGVILNITGQSLAFNRDHYQCFERRYRTWGGAKYRISDIVQQIANENDWILWDWTSTKALTDFSDLYDTMPIDKEYHQMGMTDLAFIKHILIPHALTDSDEIGGYRLWFNDQMTTKWEKPIIFFKPYDYEVKTITREYRFMRGHMGYGEVKEWNPDLSERWKAVLGANFMKNTGIGDVDKSVVTYLAKSKVTKENIGQDRARDFFQRIVSGRISTGNDVNTRVAINEDIRKFFVQSCRDAHLGGVIRAELVITGDPNRNPHEQIRVICVTNDGTTHYSSGIYEIVEITDLIDLSGYTTTMQLNKIANLDGVRTLERTTEEIEYLVNDNYA